jgi:hypothetical protein
LSGVAGITDPLSSPGGAVPAILIDFFFTLRTAKRPAHRS